MGQLRHFLYRDDLLVEEFLAQAEGGLFDEDKQTSRSGRGSKLGGSVKVGVAGGEGGRSRDTSEEVERVVRQTGASKFDRLYSSLDDEGMVESLDPVSEKAWTDLSRGQVVEIEAVVRQTGLGKVAGLFKQFEELIPIAQAMSDDAGALDAEATRILGGIAQMSSMEGDTLHVVASLLSDPKYTFALDLKNEALQTTPEELEGEGIVFAKIQRKLKPQEEHMVGAVFGGLEQMLPAESQKELVDMFNKPEVAGLGLASPLLKYPAAILTPVAIYR